MQWIKAVFIVLRQGEVLSDKAKWKNRQLTANAILAIGGALLPILGTHGDFIQHDDLAAIAGGIAAVLGMLNGYLIPATSESVGLPPRRIGDDKDAHADTNNLMG